jgi:hypothetical protein
VYICQCRKIQGCKILAIFNFAGFLGCIKVIKIIRIIKYYRYQNLSVSHDEAMGVACFDWSIGGKLRPQHPTAVSKLEIANYEGGNCVQV